MLYNIDIEEDIKMTKFKSIILLLTISIFTISLPMSVLAESEIPIVPIIGDINDEKTPRTDFEDIAPINSNEETTLKMVETVAIWSSVGLGILNSAGILLLYKKITEK